MARDPTEDLRSFVVANFDTSAISVTFSTDDIEHANYDDGPTYPSVAIVSEDPSVLGGGPMDVSAIAGGGGGAVQETVVSVLVDCWGGIHETQIYHDEGSNPDVVAKELAHETHRVCFDAIPSEAPAGYELISAAPPRSAHDTDASPTVRRYQTTCYLKYTDRP